MAPKSSATSAARAEKLFTTHCEETWLNTNKVFAWLFVIQWLGGIAAALCLSANSGLGKSSAADQLVLQAFVLGGAIIVLPLIMIKVKPTATITRHIVAVSQMLASALIVHISGGRSETHYHIFGSLALLAFYCDWPVLITASLVVALDHVFGSIYMPLSVYGATNVSPLRTLELMAWVAFADAFLIGADLRAAREMQAMARQRAEQEGTNIIIEEKVKEQLDRLRQQEERIRAVFDTAADAIFSLDVRGKILSVNRAAEQLFSKHGADLAGKNVSEYVIFQNAKDEEISFGQYADGYRAGTGKRELNARAAQGNLITVEISLGAVDVAREQLFTLVVRDISERRQSEKRMNEFYSTISHELRSPLTSIRGALGLIENGGFGDIPDEALELITIANSSTERLINLINDILDLRKIEAGKLEINKKTCNARGIVYSAVEVLEASADQANVTIDVICPEHLYLIGDESRIAQILTNLLSNAIKFTETGDRIKVVAAPASASTVKFTVTDHGPGIREEDIPKLFQKFTQLDASDTRTSEGTGLGLSICKALVEQQGGSIGVTTHTGHGSTFWFELPAVIKQFTPQDAVAVVMKQPNERTVLLVEDDQDLSKIFQALLKRDGFECLHAGSIEEAERVLSEVLPNAVIMDLGLPDGDGMNLIDKLQQQDTTKDLPVVVVTGSDKQKTAKKMVIDWLQKPFDDGKLLEAIHGAVGDHLEHKAKVLIVDDDEAARNVIKRQLADLNVECVEAVDGAEGIAMTRKHAPDLVILDIGMPRPDGYEVVDILKQQGGKNTRLIVYTAQDLTEADKQALTLGQTRHVSKASRSDTEFLSAVKELLGSGNTPPSQPV